MTNPSLRWPGLVALLESAAMARAFTLTVFASVAGTHLIESLAGRATLVTIIAAECVLAVAIIVVRRQELSLLRLVPTTLMVFLLWTLASVAWSPEPAESFLRWVSTAAVALLAVTIGHIRDTLQTVRALGDVARVLLGISLGIEILSGILFDMPFGFLGVQGNLAELGPIQGVFGTRNMLGFFAVVALVTFAIELRTQSVRTGVAAVSLTLAGAMALLSASPTVIVLVTAVSLAAAALALVRQVPAQRRRAVQWALAVSVAVAGIIGYVLRHRLIEFLGAADDLSMRTELWSRMQYYIRLQPVQGWGWFGPWDTRESFFAVLNWLLDEKHTSALNAYMDVLLQLGWAGLVLFCAFGAVALVRAWLDASQRRSVVFAWTPLLIITLAVVSVFESFALFGMGWMLLVLCAVRAGQSRSWRERLDRRRATPDLPRSPESFPPMI